MTIGIYILAFKGTDKVYVGQSIHIEERFKQHLNSIHNGSCVKKLLAAFKDFGAPSLKVLVECAIEDLNTFEDKYIQEYNAVEGGFNTLRFALGSPNAYGENSGNSKNSNEKIIEVFNMLIAIPINSAKEVSGVTNVHISVINDVSSLKGHTWLEAAFPEKYKILRTLRYNRRTIELRKKCYPKLISPKGIICTINNITEFSKKYNISESSIYRLVSGRQTYSKGWALA